MVTKKIVVDDSLINANDAQDVIEPLWWSVSIYDGEEQYENDLMPFTMPQRYVFAMQWYEVEICNGGHVQFYSNSTGIVWEDAMKGFMAIGANKNVDIIKESAIRMGGSPSKDRKEREKQIDNLHPEFDDLDDLFYANKSERMELLHIYIKTNAKDFYFSGNVIMPE